MKTKECIGNYSKIMLKIQNLLQEPNYYKNKNTMQKKIYYFLEIIKNIKTLRQTYLNKNMF